MNKLIRDGKVAVIYSPGFGAGWSTWGDGMHRESKMFDAELAEAILSGDERRIQLVAGLKWPLDYNGGLRDVVVAWVPVGTKFRIKEYDGSESIEYLDPDNYFTA